MNTTQLLSTLPQGKITLFPCRTEPNLWFCDHETKECITSFYYDMTNQQWLKDVPKTKQEHICDAIVATHIALLEG